MDLNLTNKVAVVTGASRGIGRAIAQTLSHEGMRLVLAARSLAGLRETEKLCHTECTLMELDLRKPGSQEQLIAGALYKFGRIDLLVNNAGATKRGDFFSLTDDDWQDGYDLKFFGAMRCCRAAWSHLQKSQGCIINISGIGGRTGSAEFTIGGSVNAALLNLTKSLADRGIQEGIRVNAVNPGSITTERLTARIQSYAAENHMDEATATKEMALKAGTARFGDPGEIARAVAFLASPQAGYCQGVIFDVDGGQTRTL